MISIKDFFCRTPNDELFYEKGLLSGFRLKAVSVFLILAIAALPFDSIKWGPSYWMRHLTFYFHFLAIVFAVPELIHFVLKEKIVRIVAAIFGLFLLWSFVPSCLLQPLNAASLKTWLIEVKADILWMGIAYTFTALFLILPAKDRPIILARGLYAFTLTSFLHVLIEIGWILGIPGCEDFLIFLGKNVRITLFSCDWYPPVLWSDLRVRSWFSEPSYCAIMMCFAVMMLTMDYLERHAKISMVCACICSVSLALTQSRTGFILLWLGAFCLLFFTAIQFGKTGFLKVLKACILPAIAFSLSFTISPSVFSSSSTVRNSKIKAASEFFTGGSTSTRKSLLTAESTAALEHPLTGGGAGYQEKRVWELLRECDQTTLTGECRLWVKYNAIPNLCHYFHWLIDFGPIGFIAATFLLTLPLVLFFCVFLRKKPYGNSFFLSGFTACSAAFMQIHCMQAMYHYTHMFVYGINLAFAILFFRTEKKSQ